MSVLSPLSREISAKIVYYGPGLSGKTTTLQAIYGAVRPERRGELVSLATETDRTIFFDFLPLHVERVRGLGVRFQLYTVPGQVFYAATRKLVLTGADGVVFVADSQVGCRDSNIESFESLRTNLADLGIELENFPLIMQYNKRDLDEAMELGELSSMLNVLGAPEFPTCARTGEGVLPALKEISRLVIRSLTEQQPAVRRQIVDEDSAGRGYEADRLEPDAGIVDSVYRVSQSWKDEARPSLPASTAESVASAQQSAQPLAEPSTAEAPSARPGGVYAGAASDVVAVNGHGAEPSANGFRHSIPYEPMTARPAAPGEAEGAPFSFALLWPEERRGAVREVERLCSSGDHAAAVHLAAALLADLLDSIPGPQGGSDPGYKAALLGLDGVQYLRICRLATMPAEAVKARDALLALHVLVAAWLKVQVA